MENSSRHTHKIPEPIWRPTIKAIPARPAHTSQTVSLDHIYAYVPLTKPNRFSFDSKCTSSGSLRLALSGRRSCWKSNPDTE